MGKVLEELTNGIINPDTGFLAVIENGVPRFDVKKMLTVIVVAPPELREEGKRFTFDLTLQKLKLCNRNPPVIYFSDVCIDSNCYENESVESKIHKAEGEYVVIFNNRFPELPEGYLAQIVESINRGDEHIKISGVDPDYWPNKRVA